MLDIDDFKEYNDTYGPLEGDRLLKEIGVILNSIFRSIEICCRYAGDEFAIIFPETDVDQVKAVARKIKNAVKDLDSKRTVTLSIGAAELAKNSTRYDFILKANQSLYDAKKSKKNTENDII